MTSAHNHQWLTDTLLTLVRTPTSVPAGQTGLPPGSPQLINATENVLLPLLSALEPDEIRQHECGDLALRFGPDTDNGLLIQTYLVSQHGDPNASSSSAQLKQDQVVGPGTGQNKGAMAVAFDAVRQRPSRLRHPIWLTVNTEGSSSHGGSQRILDDLKVRATHGIVMTSTGSRVSLGNRGRQDVIITVHGIPAHSSQPWLGKNPITGAADAIAALRTAPLPTPHPQLGAAAVTPYQISSSPVAPHTIPERVDVVVDRRTLPSEDPATVVGGVRHHLDAAGLTALEVTGSVYMLPALVAPAEPLVQAFEQALGPGCTFYSGNTYDAGYACAQGIPTVMFGPGRRNFGAGMLAAESITLAECDRAVQTMCRVIGSLCR